MSRNIKKDYDPRCQMTFWYDADMCDILDHNGEPRPTWIYDLYFHREDGPAVIYDVGSKWWYVDGKQHRLDGPAVEFVTGELEWWVNGVQHREDGPAMITKEKEEWLFNGLSHRYDGPALIYSSNQSVWDDDQWAIHGTVVDEGEYKAWLLTQGMDIYNLSAEDKLLIDIKWVDNSYLLS